MNASSPGDGLEGLPLIRPSPPGWLAAATGDLDALLADHAHCELKAAATALALAGRYPERTDLVSDMTALAREEIRHFERVHALIRRRGRVLPRIRGDRYVRELKRHVSPGPLDLTRGRLLDELVVAAFIEARSCERFRLLASALKGDGSRSELAELYRDLATAQARHHELFLRHAAAEAGAEAADRRTREIAALEARVVAELKPEARIH